MNNPTNIQKKITDKDKIIHLMYYVLETLGADSHMLSIIGSYGDTLDDREIVDMLQVWLDEPASYMKKVDPEKLQKVYKWLELPPEVGKIEIIAKRKIETND